MHEYHHIKPSNQRQQADSSSTQPSYFLSSNQPKVGGRKREIVHERESERNRERESDQEKEIAVNTRRERRRTYKERNREREMKKKKI